MDYTSEFISRFYAKVKTSTPDKCWNWQAGKDRYGYGKVTLNYKTLKAHRVAYEIATGIDPGDLDVLHSCDNPACCNPSHLSIGTRHENMQDRDNKNRQAKGEKHGKHKLTDMQVKEIRLLRAEKGLSQRKLASLYGVSQMQICDILRKKYR